MKHIIFKKQSGRSMVEMLGVLAIIGVLSVGAIAGYNMAMEKHRLNEVIEAINLIIQETRTMTTHQGDYNEFGEAFSKDFAGETAGGDSVAAKILERLKINTYYPISLSFASHTYVGDAFAVAIGNLPQSNCIKLYTINWSKYGSDYIGVGFDFGEDEHFEEMSVSEAQDLCKMMYDSLGFGLFGVMFRRT